MNHFDRRNRNKAPDMHTTEFPPYEGFAILIKATGTKRTFVPKEGETITLTDKHGKELWSFKNPTGRDNPGVIIYTVQIDNTRSNAQLGVRCQG